MQRALATGPVDQDHARQGLEARAWPIPIPASPIYADHHPSYEYLGLQLSMPHEPFRGDG
jgi:hypothetical protein